MGAAIGLVMGAAIGFVSWLFSGKPDQPYTPYGPVETMHFETRYNRDQARRNPMGQNTTNRIFKERSGFQMHANQWAPYLHTMLDTGHISGGHASSVSHGVNPNTSIGQQSNTTPNWDRILNEQLEPRPPGQPPPQSTTLRPGQSFFTSSRGPGVANNSEIQAAFGQRGDHHGEM